MTKEQDTSAQQHEQDGAPDFDDRGALGPQAVIPGRPDAVNHVVVKKLMGKRHWAAGWVLGLCNADPQFLVHLAEQPRGYAHYLCLIRMALTGRGAGAGNARDDARMLRASNKRKLLKELFPSCPPGMVNLLHKLPKKPMPEDAYRKLMGALEDEPMRSAMYHMERIKKPSIFMLNTIARIPERFRYIAMYCVKDADGYSTLWRAIRFIEKFDLNHAELNPFWLACQEGGLHGGSDWLVRKISQRPFPAPPWGGDDEIRPIRSPGELDETLESMDVEDTGFWRSNFMVRLPEYACRVVAGYGYIYVCDHIPAMVGVMRHVFWGWGIHEIVGATAAQQFEIKRKFFQHGFSDMSKSSSRFDDDFIDDILF